MPWPEARRRIASAFAVVGIAAATLLVVLAATVLAASPEPTPVGGGDPRSSGQGPGLVGDPLAAVVVVLVIAGLAIIATLAYVRWSAQPREGD